MNKEDYNEALKSPQWITKTKVIKENKKKKIEIIDHKIFY